MDSINATMSAYGAFCFDVWRPSPGVQTTHTTNDLVVMGYGLPGKWGEVAELLADGIPNDVKTRQQLCEELGDTIFIYYWARIARAYGMDPGEFAEGALPDRLVRTRLPVPFVKLAESALRLTAACGRVAEVMKKQRRDGYLNEELLRSSLRQSLRYWGEVCQHCDIDWRDVLQANKDKVGGRAKARATAGILTAA